MSTIGPVTPQAAGLLGVSASNLVEKAKIDAQASIAKAELAAQERIAKEQQKGFDKQRAAEAQQAEADRAQNLELATMEQEFRKTQEAESQTHDQNMLSLQNQYRTSEMERQKEIDDARSQKLWDYVNEQKVARGKAAGELYKQQATFSAAQDAAKIAQGNMEFKAEEMLRSAERFGTSFARSMENLSTSIDRSIRTTFSSLIDDNQFKYQLQAGGIDINTQPTVTPSGLDFGRLEGGAVPALVQQTVGRAVATGRTLRGGQQWKEENAAAVLIEGIAKQVTGNAGLEAFRESTPQIQAAMTHAMWAAAKGEKARRDGDSVTAEAMDQTLRESFETIKTATGDPFLASKLIRDVGRQFEALLASNDATVGTRLQKDDRLRQVFEFMSGIDDATERLTDERGNPVFVPTDQNAIEGMQAAMQRRVVATAHALRMTNPDDFAAKMSDLQAQDPKLYDKFVKDLGDLAVEIKEAKAAKEEVAAKRAAAFGAEAALMETSVDPFAVGALQGGAIP